MLHQALDGRSGTAAGEALPIDEAPAEGLSLVSICKSYRKHRVLDELSLSVRPGEVVGLLGPDGAGKSTCFHTIIGLIKPDSGRVVLDGLDVTGLPTYLRARLGLGYLPQEASVFRGLTVEQNVRAALELSEANGRARAVKLEKLLADFHLDELRGRRANLLSGGERRRCEIVRALASDPSIMLLDEPFAGIDPITISEIERLVVELKIRGVGVLITDYNLHEIMHLIDRGYVIADGRMVFEGTAPELAANPTVRRLYLGKDFEL